MFRLFIHAQTTTALTSLRQTCLPQFSRLSRCSCLVCVLNRKETRDSFFFVTLIELASMLCKVIAAAANTQNKSKLGESTRNSKSYVRTYLIDSSAVSAVSLHSSGTVSTLELCVCHFSTHHSLAETRVHLGVQARV